MKRTCCPALVLCCFAFALIQPSQTLLFGKDPKPKATEKVVSLPKGDWQFSALPLWLADQEVNVVAVTSTWSEGLRVVAVKVENKSTRPVHGIRLAWALLEIGELDTNLDFAILASGSTPQLKAHNLRQLSAKTEPNLIRPGTARFLEHQLVDFAVIAGDLFGRDTAIEGRFQIMVKVEEVFYGDESEYLGAIDDLMIFEASTLGTGGGPPTGEQSPCPNQKCLEQNQEGVIVYYCGANPGSWCEVHDQGRSCTVSRCDDQFTGSTKTR